jgi:hypothetical protein
MSGKLMGEGFLLMEMVARNVPGYARKTVLLSAVNPPRLK